MSEAALRLDGGLNGADKRAALEEEDEKEDLRRQSRYDAAELEILAVLQEENVDGATRTRRMMSLFDRFRYEYMQLSTTLREQIRTQRRIMDKCLEMKNELVRAAFKIKTTQHMQDEEMKNLVFYRDECEVAWKERKLSEERERDAMRIIDDLKSEIEELQNKVKALVSTSTALPTRRGMHSHSSSAEDPQPQLSSPLASREFHAGSFNSPSKMAALKKQTVLSSQTGNHHTHHTHPLLSFDEWKLANRVWTPTVAAPRSATPSLEYLYTLEKKQEIARCVSVPSLQPTAMDKISGATLVASPSPIRSKNHKPRTAVGFGRATTSSGSRAMDPLPHV
uniref:Uncharacterized protein n=1 Tax=Globisporangium ultimum (strain ATCC 200006 / CBS 805.95 / DAOM BR144) TaxID=431595 RepID=K3WC63_GLOUD